MRQPVLFVGHGSPMNAIEDNTFTRAWKGLGEKIKPKAILMVSAHWFTKGTFTQDSPEPAIINDMYGFPRELYEVGYHVKGDKELSEAVLEAVERPIQIRNDWGIDHGTWSVLVHMYPKRDIPVVQLSVNMSLTPQEHFEIGLQLKKLRDQGIFIIGSGNVVHNLRYTDFDMPGGHDWAEAFDESIKDKILKGVQKNNLDDVLDYTSEGTIAKLAVPTPDHFNPLLYILGARDKEDNLIVFNNQSIMGGLSMTSYLFG